MMVTLPPMTQEWVEEIGGMKKILTIEEEATTMREAVHIKRGSEKNAGRFCTIGDPLQAPP